MTTDELLPKVTRSLTRQHRFMLGAATVFIVTGACIVMGAALMLVAAPEEPAEDLALLGCIGLVIGLAPGLALAWLGRRSAAAHPAVVALASKPPRAMFSITGYTKRPGGHSTNVRVVCDDGASYDFDVG